RDRRQHVFRVNVCQAANGYRVSRVQVNDGAGFFAFPVHRQVQERFLGGFVAGEVAAGPVHLGEALGFESSQAGIGRRHENPIVQSGAEIARAATTIAPLVERTAMHHDSLAQFLFVHGSIPSAWMKKSSLPKLPDFSARASRGWSSVSVHGTPGTI